MSAATVGAGTATRDAVKQAAKGRWPSILGQIGISVSSNPKQHTPCPTCGGEDRFRFDDLDGDGTWYCNQCEPKSGDGFSLIQNVKGCSFPQALQLVADELQLQPTNGHSSRKIIATYPYTDASGVVLFQVVRFDPKDFRQRRPDGYDGWIWNLSGIETILYRLSDVLKATHVLKVEGEKDVDRAYTLGLPEGWAATCNPMGAGKWKDSYSDTLQGKHVVILPDADEPGRKHGEQVAESLQGKAASIQRLTLPDGSKDLSEWAANGRTIEEFHTLLATGTPWTTEEAAQPSRVKYRCLSTVTPQAIDWLWPGWIAKKKTTMLAGNPGLGKSHLALDLAARVSAGSTCPDGAPCAFGNVVILSGEDDAADTIRPRLEAAGADLSKVFILDAISDTPEAARTFNLKTDVDRLGEMLEAIGGAALVIVDPISSYLGSTDSHNNAEMRGLLTPLEKLAQDHGAAVLLVSHLNKNASGDPVGRVMGSLAFVAAARGAFVVVSDPENPARRLFLPLKNNLGTDQTGLAFSVGSKQITGPGGATITTSHIEWESGPITLTAREALQPESGREQGEDLVEAKNFLLALLADGAVSSKQVQADAAGAGHSWRTIQRAQKSLGIVAYKTGLKQGWAWRLPPKEASLKSKYSSKTASGSTPSNPLEDHEGCQPGSKTATVLGQEAAGGLHGGLQEQDELPETDAAELEVFNL